MSEHIWIVRDPSGKVIGASVVPRGAIRDVKAHCGSTTAGIMNKLSCTVDTTGQHYAQDGYTLTREPLTPAPRVVVLDEWRVVGTDNKEPPFQMNCYTRLDAEVAAERNDRRWPEYAPHRVVRVALVEEALTEAPADGA
jgi:hypothetical protein